MECGEVDDHSAGVMLILATAAHHASPVQGEVARSAGGVVRANAKNGVHAAPAARRSYACFSNTATTAAKPPSWVTDSHTRKGWPSERA